MLLISDAIFLGVVISKNKMLAFPECLPESGKLDIMLLGDSFGSTTRPRHNNVGHRMVRNMHYSVTKVRFVHHQINRKLLGSRNKKRRNGLTASYVADI